VGCGGSWSKVARGCPLVDVSHRHVSLLASCLFIESQLAMVLSRIWHWRTLGIFSTAHLAGDRWLRRSVESSRDNYLQSFYVFFTHVTRFRINEICGRSGKNRLHGEWSPAPQIIQRSETDDSLTLLLCQHMHGAPTLLDSSLPHLVVYTAYHRTKASFVLVYPPSVACVLLWSCPSANVAD
jgi:hypothetical protein